MVQLTSFSGRDNDLLLVLVFLSLVKYSSHLLNVSESNQSTIGACITVAKKKKNNNEVLTELFCAPHIHQDIQHIYECMLFGWKWYAFSL